MEIELELQFAKYQISSNRYHPQFAHEFLPLCPTIDSITDLMKPKTLFFLVTI